MRLVVDVEADNLLEEANTIWCIVAKNIEEKYDEAIYYFQPNEIEAGLEFISEAEELILHNGVGYDLPLFEKLYDFKYDGLVTDTLILSRLQWPDRPLPKGYIGQASHSVEAWGHRLGFNKPEHDDWSQYSPEMLYRCKEDVLGTEKIYNYLLEERKR